MNQDLLALIQKHKNKGIVIDANVAILYIIGSLDPQRTVRDKRTSMYNEDDFDRLSKFINVFRTKIVTPHILTEISNLLGKDLWLRKAFAGFIEISDERFIASKETVNNPIFSSLGLTDAAIFDIAKTNHLVVTDDAPLSMRLLSHGTDVVSLSKIRQI